MEKKLWIGMEYKSLGVFKLVFHLESLVLLADVSFWLPPKSYVGVGDNLGAILQCSMESKLDAWNLSSHSSFLSVFHIM